MRIAAGLRAAVALASFCAASCAAPGVMAASLERVAFDGASRPSVPGDRLQGLLAKPDGAGPFPAVVALHGCAGMHDATQRKLAGDLVAWGYAALLADSFAARGIDHACTHERAVAIAGRRVADAYGALAFLARQPFVDTRRVAAMGFSQGGWIALSVAEARSHQPFVLASDLRFRAAVAFYPPCRAAGSRPAIPALILVGAADDWTPPEDCTSAAARWSGDGPPVEQVVYPGTHHGFYYPHLRPGRRLFGHWVEYNEGAAEDAGVRMRRFLDRHLN